jgi:hypothetical protein
MMMMFTWQVSLVVRSKHFYLLSFVFNFSVLCRKANLLLSVVCRQGHDVGFLFKIECYRTGDVKPRSLMELSTFEKNILPPFFIVIQKLRQKIPLKYS